MYDVIIIGAGIAGAAVAHQCAVQGLSVLVLEQGDAIAQKASGNPAGILYPYMASNYDAMTAFYLQGLAHSVSLLKKLDAKGKFHDLCGMLHLPKLSHQLSDLQGLSASLKLPESVMQPHQQGFFMESSGWVNVPSFCTAMLDAANINIRLDVQIIAMKHELGCWNVTSSLGEYFIATNLVIASAYEAQQLLPQHNLPMNRIRGQITYLPAAMLHNPQSHVLCYGGYLTPAINGVHYLGATFEKGRDDLAVDESGHLTNINLLQNAALSPLLREDILSVENLSKMQGRAGFRTVSGDRFPIIGATYDAIALNAQLDLSKYSRQNAANMQVPYLPNLYVSLGHGARGLVSAPLAASFIANNIIKASYNILNNEMIKLLSTQRFALRNWRKNVN